MLLTNHHISKLFDHIYPGGDILSSIAWLIRYSYHFNLKVTTGESIFGIDMIFKFASFIDWKVITPGNQHQVKIDDAWKYFKIFIYYYSVGDLLYLDNTLIYRKFYFKKRVLYRIITFFTNSTVLIQRY